VLGAALSDDRGSVAEDLFCRPAGEVIAGENAD
jgi:hypothetical protein